MYLYTRHLNLYIMIYHSTLLTCALYDLLYHHKEKLHVNLPIPVRRRDDLTSHVSHMLATRRNRAKRTRMPNPGTPEAQKAPISTSTLHVSPQATPTILLPSRHATMPPKSTPPARKSAPPSSPDKNAYLLAYNAPASCTKPSLLQPAKSMPRVKMGGSRMARDRLVRCRKG
jgi:hypothetical protein